MRNAALLLLAREGGAAPRCRPADATPTSTRLQQWAEVSLTSHCSASYASFQPPPRSTIALSYNCDGTLLASTHGDHTVKLSSCTSGRLVRVLSGHRRTPWVVRFHPRKPNLLASGSLDHEVRLWDADTGQCIAKHTFGKPIASLAFHVCVNVLAIGCGHKLYMWEYSAQGKLPVIVLKTRRSMRAVHFHPQGLPVVLTAEVQDPSPTPELPATLTEQGCYMQQQQPEAEEAEAMDEGGARRFAPSRPGHSLRGDGDGGAAAQQPAAGAYAATHDAAAPRGRLAAAGGGRQPRPAQLDLPGAALALSGPLQHLHLRAATPSPTSVGDAAATSSSSGDSHPQSSAPGSSRPGAPGWVPPGSAQLPPSMVPTGWELPFPSNLFAAAQPQPGSAGARQGDGSSTADAGGWAATSASLPQVMAAFSAAAWNIIGEEQPPRVRLRIWRFDVDKPTSLLAIMGSEQGSGNLRLQISDAVLCSEMGVHFSPCGRFLAGTTACRGPLPAAVAGGMLGEEDGGLPLQHESDAMLAALGGDAQRAEALLSSHGLAAPMLEAAGLGPGVMLASGAASQLLERGGGGSAAAAAAAVEAAAAAAAAAAQHRPERVVFEVRVYSLDGPTFGQVVRAKRIRAAHCLTSVQFSPCCGHMLLAYGKKHISLLRSLVADRGAVVPLHTILEVFRLRDMALVRVLPSADDEINAACFHPRAGGGIAYGTKEGRLRIIAHDRSHLAEDDGRSSSGGTSSVGAAGTAEEHPTQRELDTLREFVLTQQWLQHQALGDAPGGGAGGRTRATRLRTTADIWRQG